MADTVPWRPRTADIPAAPGVYRFRDERGRILYVGKAKSLKQRLQNYFQPLQSLHERTRRMVLTAASVEWTIVGSEFEALQLEYTWIKEYEPPFNVQFRDDKSYPYLAVTLGEDVPRVMVTRNRGMRGARYFGPYTKVWAIRETLDALLKAFPMRSCSQSIFDKARRDGRPCLLGDIGKCSAPCVERVTEPEHRDIAKKLISFMAGADQVFVEQVRKQMLEASEALQFERAGRLRDQIVALETVLAKTSVVLADRVDSDVFGLVHDELQASLHLFTVRGGRIRGTRSWVVDTELDLPEGELAEQLLRIAYDTKNVDELAAPAKEVLLPVTPDSPDAVEQWLTGQRHAAGLAGKVRVRKAQRGEKKQLTDSATVNAAHALQVSRTKRTSDYVTRTQALTDLQDALGLEQAPLRIECFDISHLGGQDVVGSMVVFEDGLPRKNHYRKFSVLGTTDDTASMHQVLKRRLKYLRGDETDPEENENRFSYSPQLLIVDGGLPQVNAAKRAMDESGIVPIPIVGIAKRLEELWVPGDDYPVILPRTSEALYLVQRLRDEAHRFAIRYQRTKRSSAIESELSGITGLGPSRVKALLKHFGSAKRVRAADAKDIAEVKGIGPALATAIHETLASDSMKEPVQARGQEETP